MGKETIQISYFAKLRELTGCSAETMDFVEPTSVSTLYQTIQNKYGGLLDPELIAFCINDVYVSPGHPVRSGDHVVFIPPVAGG